MYRFFFILLIFLLIDVDECSINLHNCAHVCSNIVGSFNCSCQNGFILQPDGRTCEGMIMCIILKGSIKKYVDFIKNAVQKLCQECDLGNKNDY